MPSKPASIYKEILELLGESEAIKFIRHFQGRKLYFFEGKEFPANADISLESWQSLCARFNKNQLQITVGEAKMLRNQSIINKRRNGIKIGDIASSSGLSYRQVINICNRFR